MVPQIFNDCDVYIYTFDGDEEHDDATGDDGRSATKTN